MHVWDLRKAPELRFERRTEDVIENEMRGNAKYDLKDYEHVLLGEVLRPKSSSEELLDFLGYRRRL